MTRQAGGLEGRVPTPRGYPVPLHTIFFFRPVTATCVAVTGLKGDFGGGFASPEPPPRKSCQ